MKWTAYWRNCLADADSTKGVFNRKELAQKRNISSCSLRSGCLSAEENDGELFNDEQADTIAVKAHIWTFAFVKRNIIEHGKQKNSALPDSIAPIICPVWITRSGRLYPTSAPFVSRDTLAPQHQDVITVSTVEQVDHFLSNASVPCLTESGVEELERDNPEQHALVWDQAYNTARGLYVSACQAYLDERGFKDLYEVSPDGAYLEKIETSGGAFHIINAYDLIRENKPTLPLLNTYATYTCQNRQPCEDYTTSISKRIAHSGEVFPSADAQRDALTSTLDIEPGKMIAINGPPGTGKTTFVLSAVASLWARAALKEGEPPIIVAASTNNQAVTNIIEAFGNDFDEGKEEFAGRWLPDVTSYGGYLPARSREKDAAKKYQTNGFYNGLENRDYLDKAAHYFIEKAALAMPHLDLNSDPKLAIEAIKIQLHTYLKNATKELEKIQHNWQCYEKKRKLYYENLGNDPKKTLEDNERALAREKIKCKTLGKSLNQWRYLLSKQSIIESFFLFLPIVKKKRQARIKHFVHTQLCKTAQLVYQNDREQSFEKELEQALIEQKHTLAAQNRRLRNLYQYQEEFFDCQRGWKNSCEAVFDKYGSDPNDRPTPELDKIDKWLDTHVRFLVFRLSVHYWEARWLLACFSLGKDIDTQEKKTGEKASLARWHRRMMITPCIVSTCHALPDHMSITRYHESKFHSDYLFNHIDWLIVDEAGQVSPEVAGASMSFAKRAIVIGDTQQIQPIRSLTSMVDQGNLTKAGLTEVAPDYEKTKDMARLVTRGSVMQIAQQASRVHHHPDAEPGILLREHRRCYDDIIEYCNRLCYNGLLIPKRGAAEHNTEIGSECFPALGYAHVDGAAIRQAGSTSNRVEAIAIANWLRDNRKRIEAQFGEPLEQAVGIVTPFRAQVNVIKEACQDNDIHCDNDNKKSMTVGTVHSLQGAARKLVIFSHVYSRHQDGQFIDIDTTMLNVAVSRAKDSFIIFADMQTLAHAREGSPRKLLADMLLWRDNNALRVDPVERSDLLSNNKKPQSLVNALEHDQFLHYILEYSKLNVDIVSPWIQARTLKKTTLDQAMKKAVKRGVKVRIYTDRHFNTTQNNRYNPQKQQQLENCIAELSASGIDVYVVDGVHSKIVMADDTHMAVGSYNWLSAARQGRYSNIETSLYYSGQLKHECQTHLATLVPEIVSEATPA